MKRVYTAWKCAPRSFIDNDLLSLIVEGIQERGGDIVSLNLMPLSNVTVTERIVILYEDNGNYEQIKEFLKGKEGDTRKWTDKI